jgi:hypothetical protein
MGQAYTKGAKKRAKKAAKQVKDLYADFEREASQILCHEPQEAPQEAQKRARAIALGVDPTDEVLDAYLETEAGKALFVAVENTDERKGLVQTFQDYDKAHRLFMSRCVGQRMFPAVSKMEFMPERLEADASDVVDLRTPEEKADSARQRMREYDEMFRQMHSWQANIIKSVSYRQETLVVEGEITAAGRSFVAAIRALHEIGQTG